MELVLAVVLLAVVAVVVSVPLRRPVDRAEDPREAELADLEERKRVRYREIRDLAADHAAGKLGDEDFQRLDRELRADAIEILKRIDALSPGGRRVERDP